MPLKLRRVVTGHDAQGQSIVSIDETPGNIESRRPGHSSCVIWSAHSVPANNNLEIDEAQRDAIDCAEQGAIFRVVEYAPGVASRMHRTMTVDYAIVMSGEIDMVLDGGKEVHLRAGDLIVQRGTVHDWINRGAVPCQIAFILIASRPVQTHAGRLGPQG